MFTCILSDKTRYAGFFTFFVVSYFIVGKLIRDHEEFIVNSGGELSTWAKDYILHFETKDKLLEIINEKLKSRDYDIRGFILKFFTNIIFDFELIKCGQFIDGLKNSLVCRDYETFELFTAIIGDEVIAKMYQREFEEAKEYYDFLSRF